jgi:hypothetical protein
MFTKNIRILYLYVVSFLALMAIIYGVVSLVEKVTNYFYPVDYVYNQPYVNSYDEKNYTIQDENEYTTQNDYDVTIQRDNVQVRTLREMFTAIAIILVAVPLYGYHWTLAQKERKKEEV